MYRVRAVLLMTVVLCVVAMAGESRAVIYKYLDEKGEPAYVDDLGKVPEQERAKVVIVTGKEEQELVDDAERARALAERQAALERQASPPLEETETFLRRLALSGIGVLGAAAIMFLLANIEALKEKGKLIRNARIGLIAFAVVFAGVVHFRDVVGLFGRIGGTVTAPISGIQEKQAARGKRAAESYKAMDRVVDKAQDDLDRIQKQFEEAEQGK